MLRARVAAERVRAWLLPLVILAGLSGFARLIQADFPIQRWLFWRYLMYWSIALLWLSACFSCGHALLRRVLRAPLPILEQVTMSLAVGLLAFFLLMFAGGLARLYGSVFFVALPLFMLASGARPSLTYLRRLLRGLKRARAGACRPLSLVEGALWALGVLALFLFYLPGIVPSHISYDGAWYHVPLGEHYARLGRIEPFAEGWYAGAMPHLSSIVYCFAFLLPKGSVFDFVELSAHLEFASILMMLPGIPALVRRLVPRARAHVSWIAFFAFPSLLWYDLLIGGDQFAAVWSVPICLALTRALPDLSWRHGFLLACVLAGEALTKYSADAILAGPILAVALRMAWLAARARSPRSAWRALSGGLVVAASLLVLTAPHWAKNWLWYGNPLYPVFNDHFAPRLWSADAAVNFHDFQQEMQTWQPKPGIRGLRSAVWAVFRHAFEPFDFSSRPYRGALFTLTCAALPFVPASRRLWGIVLVLHVALLCWFIQLHEDRYLLTFMPAMAAVAVAIAILAWRTSLAARMSVLALFVFHSIWSLGAFALSAPISNYRNVLDFAAGLADGTKDAGLGDLARWARIGETLPADAKVLVHAMHGHTGLGHPSVNDWSRFQGGISYGRLDSPAAVYERLRALGVTHLLWQLNWGDDSFSGDLRFFEFAARYTSAHQIEGMWVGTMPKVAPPAASDGQLIAFLSCEDRYEAGLYPFSAMTVPNPRNVPQPPYPRPLSAITPANEAGALARAHYVVFNPTCGFSEPDPQQGFTLIADRGGYRLFARGET